MNILVIEPSRIFQLSLESIFKEYTTKIFITTSGQEAVSILENVRIDLICLSYYLADMDGIEVVSHVRQMEFGETIPILMITSKKSQESALKSLNSGVTEIFRKQNLNELEKYLEIFAEHARQKAQLEGNILVIDSDLKQATDIQDFFKDTALKFIHFTNAENAAQIAKAAEFDLVITNIVLDGPMSGIAFIRKIRKINETMYRVPILVISAISSVSQKIGILRAGANDYIQKPIVLEELSVRMKNLLLNKKLFDTVELQKEQLEKMATRDSLTGLYNRHYLLRVVRRAIDDAYRYNYPFSLLVIDLDHFKKVNDEHGHAIGDVVLKDVGKLLLKTFRGSDTPVRFGGEEFVILLPHCDGKDAIGRAEDLIAQIRLLRPASIPISASIGVSQILSDVKAGYDELFAAADTAVYGAKENGRNCVVFQELTNPSSKSKTGM
ncbi:MAG: diguanylate cyclase [Desulfotalea sp.]